MARIGFYPGSFDPVTYGHLDIIARAARLADRLVLGVGTHHGKHSLIPVETRMTLLETVTRPIAEHTGARISVTTFGGLAVDAARAHHAGFIIRGLRDATDFDYEVQMAQMNVSLAPDIETVFLSASPATRMIASSLVKQIARMGGDISLFVPKEAQTVMAAVLATASH
ncbi:pantetheine-phosphate adenylyltransferase [Aestuariivirga sp.]|uniref:pantetheine-phosphate adenylyltransferase n=1 Tax=Aestuariivirga sp. TaxID=2650926 RepID=UPI00378454C9